MNIPALKVQDLSVWFETTSGRRQVVDNISFSLDAGQATGLVGESGCGKTMTAMAILGLLPTPGIKVQSTTIEVNGKEISRLGAKQRQQVLGHDIAMIFQQPGLALDPVFTIGQQISAVCRRHSGNRRTSIRQAVLETLSSVGFRQAEEIAAAYPHQLSGGMRQLAMIAMATVCKPAVIIADEPTTALDSSTRALILKQLEQLQDQHGCAILLISHDLAIVRRSCRDVMVMYCGRLVEQAACESLFSHARHPYSAGLISCIPRIGNQRPAAIKAIPGHVPLAGKLPTGCHFAPRCTRAEPQCAQSVPAYAVEDRSAVACFRPL